MLKKSGFLFSLMACNAASELPPASLGEVCGQDAPFRVLALEPGVRLAGAPRAHSERVVLRVGTYGAPTSSGLAPSPKNTALWSIGPCGESPHRLDVALQDLAVADRWPDILLGRRPATRELTILDVTGASDEHVVFTGIGPSTLYWTDHGLVTFETRGEDTGAALLHRYPDDPNTETAMSVVLLDSLFTRNVEGRVSAYEFDLLADEMIARTTDNVIVRVSLIDGSAVTEYTNVKAHAVSPDGRWLLWQALVGDPNDPKTSGPLSLRDLKTTSEISLGDAFLDNTRGPFDMYDAGYFVANIEPYANGKQRVYKINDLSFVDLPEDRTLFHVFSDGRFAIGSFADDGIDLYDPVDGSVTPLVAHGVVEWWGDDEFEVLDVPPYWLEGASYIDEGPLYNIPLTGTPQKLADSASSVGFRRGNGRRILGVDIGDDLLGQLILIDPDEPRSKQIDEHAFAFTARISTAFGGETLVYSVDDDDRTGVWLAQLAD